MKWLQREITSLCIFLFLALQAPLLSFADENENPITKLKDKMKFNWKIIDNADWLFYLVMLVLSGLMLYLLVINIWAIILHLVKVRHGRANLKDKNFWIEVIVVFVILFLVFSGAFWKVLEAIYTWTSHQDIGGTGGTGGAGGTGTTSGG